jgi:catechol 2,3-dioxygenase-like lactoylglutathione lyase family enzyme
LHPTSAVAEPAVATIGLVGHRPVAILKVTDIDRTIEWYTAAGFRLRERHRLSDREWCEMSRAGTVLQFLSGETPWDGSPSLTGCIYVPVEDADAALSDLSGPVSAPWGVERRPWGATEVVLQDPDDYFIALSQAPGDDASGG